MQTGNQAIHSPILIIGAGPAGLAVAGRLRKADMDFEMLEKTDKIAWSWHNHYDRLCLHTVKQLSHLPFLPFPEEYPLYVPREDLAQYYEDYASHFNIQPNFNEEVLSIRPDKQGWLTQTVSGKAYHSQSVVVATGVNRVPYSPQWPGQELFKGEIIHSRNYKNALPFKGSKTLVIGMGNTGAEIALDLAENDVDVSISVRSPINIVPRDINGRPVQLTARQLAKLPFGLGDWLGTQVRKWVIGDLSRFGLQTSGITPAEQLRTTGKTPVIDLGTVEHIKKGKIKIVPDIERFEEREIRFADQKQRNFDKIILCTGYRAQIEDFMNFVDDSLLDKYQVPKAPVGEGKFKGLYFVGFDNYKLGGILGTITTDSKTVTDHIISESATVEKEQHKPV